MPYRWTLTNLSDLTTEVLLKDPIGWDDGTYSIKRSEIYKGAFHEYTTSLKFHCSGGGKEFIDNIYQTEDIDGRIDVLLEYDCDGSGTYDELFNGVINLASYQTDGNYTNVNIEKSDLLTKLFSRDEISVDLSSSESIGKSAITPIVPIDLQMHSQEIFMKSAIVGDVPFVAVNDNAVVDAFNYGGFISHSALIVRNDLNTFDGVTDYNDFQTPALTTSTSDLTPVFIADDNDILFPVEYTYRVNISGTFHDILESIQTRQNFAHSLVLAYGQTLSTATQITLYTTSGYTTGSLDYSEAFSTGDVSANITINEDDRVWLYWYENETITTGPYNGSLIYQYNYDTYNFSLEVISKTISTTCKSFLVHEAFNQVVDSIADSDGNFHSDFYGRTDSEKQTYADDGCGSKIAITNGLNIRKIEKPIHCSFRTLFENFDCIHNIGMGVVSSKIRVEPLSYWFSDTKIITLDRVNSYHTKNDNTRYINKIDIGYSKWESEFNGGLDDPNTKHEYSTKINSAKTVYNKLSPYISSGYSIEFTRRKWNDNVTEDWRFDNDNFVVSSIKKNLFTASFIPRNAPLDDQLFLFGYNFTDVFSAGDSITITGSASNNATFTITSIIQAINGAVLTVAESVTTELLVDVSIAQLPYTWNSERLDDSFSYGSGMVSIDTAYNTRLTPARMLQAHMNVITAGLQTINGDVSFVKGDGNTDLECSANLIAYTTGCQEEYSGQQLKENQSFAWNDTNVKNIAPIWGTEIYSFEYPLSYNEFKAIKANPYGYIEFYKFADSIKYGFILSMEYKMKTGLTKFELLKKA